MSGVRILLVEDETHIARGLIFNLEQEGYEVTHVTTGEAALERIWQETYALAVLDLMLPGLDGLEVCRRIRRQSKRLPILILTARAQERDRVRGLELGADDYLTKPFSLEEFLLRVKGMLRRSSWYRPEPVGEELYRFGANEVNLKEHLARTPAGEIPLTDLEVKMLRVFFQKEGEVLARQELLAEVWGLSPDTETRTLDNFIVRMRKYFEADPARPVHFLTIRSRGYRFVRGDAEG